MTVSAAIGIILLFIGLFFYLSEIIGLYKFRHTINRMHAAALGDTLGLLFCIAGILLLRGFSPVSLKLMLIPLFVFLTSPVASHLIAKTEVKYHGNRNGAYKKEER